MSEQQRLQQEIAQCQRRWHTLSEKLDALEEAKDRETRAEEKIRLDASISETKTERQQVEKEWQALEARELQHRKTQLIQDARRMERNSAYPEAIETWETIRALDPEDRRIDGEIQRIQGKRQQRERLNNIIQQLIRHMREIKPIYGRVIRRLRQMTETGVEDAALLTLAEDFLAGDLSAAEFTIMWQELNSYATPPSIVEPDYPALADRLKRGEFVVFLGSDIPRLFAADVPDTESIALQLAQQAGYGEFSGSLSMIAEYYQMRPEYGRSSLVRNLHALLPTASVEIPLYQLLASIEQPLVLVSAAYDTLLENTFRQAGKKYLLISSFISTTPDRDMGKVVVHYSDKDAPEPPLLEEDLSRLASLDAGYSLIYKIRGYCNFDERHPDVLTLSEDNYFSFARHMDTLIPNYVVRQFTGRGLILLGYAPRQWEDRLIVNAIMNKRRNHPEPALTIRKDVDRFETAYWERHHVHRYGLDVVEFVEKLETSFQ